MESKKHSSIEWLFAQMPTGIYIEYQEEFEEAKELHKQEIIDACEEFGNLNGVDIEDYTEYYNQIFNQE
jgi:hypothetical protein